MRRRTVACNARTRIADCSRAIIRATGSDASADSAIGMAASRLPSAKAIVGTIGPLTVAICRHSMREDASLVAGPGSAITTAAGLTEIKAVGASTHLASTMGKAPAEIGRAHV